MILEYFSGIGKLKIFQNKKSRVQSTQDFFCASLFSPMKTGKVNAPKHCNLLLENGFPAVCKFLTADESKNNCNDFLQNEGDEKLADKLEKLELEIIYRQMNSKLFRRKMQAKFFPCETFFAGIAR